MDPDANLTEQLELARKVARGEPEYADDDCVRLAELVLALDGWITAGGFLPRRWKKEQS